MKVAILHHDLEFAEERIGKTLEDLGHKATLIDIREGKINYFKKSDLVLNRVYASVANRDYSSIPKTLELLNNLEKNGIYCLNSWLTSKYDYSKYASFIIMKNAGIRSPETIFINEEKDLDKKVKMLEEKLGLPMIIKRDTGGRGKEVSKVDSINEIYDDLKNKFQLAQEEKYFGGFIAQEFIKSARDHDCRIGVINGEPLFSYGRSLIAHNSKEIWLASMSNGSKKVEYEAQQEEREIASKTSNLIGAKFNELDIIFSKEGPVVIENNPTPNYFNSPAGRKKIKFFVNEIMKLQKEQIN